MGNPHISIAWKALREAKFSLDMMTPSIAGLNSQKGIEHLEMLAGLTGLLGAQLQQLDLLLKQEISESSFVSALDVMADMPFGSMKPSDYQSVTLAPEKKWLVGYLEKVSNRNPVGAIKFIRNALSIGLKEAKDVCDGKTYIPMTTLTGVDLNMKLGHFGYFAIEALPVWQHHPYNTTAKMESDYFRLKAIPGKSKKCLSVLMECLDISSAEAMEIVAGAPFQELPSRLSYLNCELVPTGFCLEKVIAA